MTGSRGFSLVGEVVACEQTEAAVPTECWDGVCTLLVVILPVVRRGTHRRTTTKKQGPPLP